MKAHQIDFAVTFSGVMRYHLEPNVGSVEDRRCLLAWVVKVLNGWDIDTTGLLYGDVLTMLDRMAAPRLTEAAA